MSTEGSRTIRRILALGLLLGSAALVLSVATRARLERADFVFNNGAEVTTLDPQTVAGVPEGRVLYALFEGLTVRDPRTLAPLPGMAESWEVSPDGLVYTFYLREGAKWSDGEPVTAEDFVWSWKRLLSPETAAEYVYQLWMVRGAREYSLLPDEGARESAWQEVGIRATGPRTLVVELAHPTPYFLDLTSFYPLFPVNRASLESAKQRFPDTWQSEWVRPENLVTNGAYRVQDRRVNDRIRLAKNPLYWDEANVAMRTIDVLAVEHYGTMLNLYLEGEIDWIDRTPPSLAQRLLEREDFSPSPYLGTYFYRVNTTRPPYDDPRVRKALALAIDRHAICSKIQKKGESPSWSLTPLGLERYPRPEMEHAPPPHPELAPGPDQAARAFEEDCARAVSLLRDAGYLDGGRALAPIVIHYNTSEQHRDIAEVIADGWKRHLGIEVKLLNQEWKVYLDTQKRLEYDVTRSAWIGDYPDPNTFLEIFVTGNDNNRTGWSNARYDELVQEASRERDPALRFELLAEAEALLLDELPILPIFSYVTQNMVNPRLGGFFENVRDDHFPKFFYWMNDQELAKKRAKLDPRKQLVPARGPQKGLYASSGRNTAPAATGR